MCYPLAAMAVLMVVSTAMTVHGQMQQAEAADQQAKYQAQVAANNAVIQRRNADLATRNASYTEQQGALNEQNQIRNTRALIGSQIAAEGANGILVNEGSALDLHESTARLGAASGANIRDDAARKAAGFRIQGLNAEMGAQDSEIQGRAALAQGAYAQEAASTAIIGTIASNSARGLGTFYGGDVPKLAA